MDIISVKSEELGKSLVTTTTDSQRYENTDCQLSNTASIQYEYLSADNSVMTL
jgi:hypothetical protein